MAYGTLNSTVSEWVACRMNRRNIARGICTYRQEWPDGHAQSLALLVAFTRIIVVIPGWGSLYTSGPLIQTAQSFDGNSTFVTL